MDKKMYIMDKKIGIIGGGQLAKMLMEAGIPWNLHFNILDQNPTQESICGGLAKTRIEGSLHDPIAIKKLVEISDIITYEIEDINVDALIEATKGEKMVIPNPHVLKIIQNKGIQKEHLQYNNIPVVPFCYYNKDYSITDKTVVIKQCQGGYDGRGVTITKASDFDFDPKQEYIIEDYIENPKEYSIIVARDIYNNIDTYPITEMVFNYKNMLEYQISPALLDDSIKERMHKIAKDAVDVLSSPGIFAVELFLFGNNIYVNEISPRPHNSGHHTIEANETSQFKQLLYILLKSNLEPTTLLSPSLMFNLLGPKEYTGSYKLCVENPNYIPLNIWSKYPGIHIYGKNPSKPYRKLGHVTILEQDHDLLKEKYELYKRIIKIVPTESKTTPHVSIIMGSISDHPIMEETGKILQEFGVTYEVHIISAHRTPDRMYSYAKEAQKKGIKIIIAGAGGAAHLPGMTASLTNLPVIGVPIKTSTLSGIDSLHSIVQMPSGVPVATMAINGAKNAGLMAVRILALDDSGLQSKLDNYNKKMYDIVMEMEENVSTDIFK